MKQLPGMLALWALLAIALFPPATHAAGPGDVDPSFDTGTGVGNGSLGVQAIAVQADGKAIIVGDFTNAKARPRNGFARLNADGSLDTAFNPALSFSAGSRVSCVAVQTDGKILVVGSVSIHGNNVARLNADGSLDPSFNPDSRANEIGCPVAVASDGKVFVSGSFRGADNLPRGPIIRLNADGSLDTSFAQKDEVGSIASIALQADGKVLIGGSIFLSDGTQYIQRLNADGSLDGTFNVGTGPNDGVESLALQTDGKIVIGGDFTTVNGTSRGHIARLNANGSVDTSFSPITGADGKVDAIVLQADGKVVIGGWFGMVNGTSRSRIARLRPNGSSDPGFDPGKGANNLVFSVAGQANGSVFIGGGFSKVNDISRNCIAHLNADGSVDTDFDPGTGADDTVYSLAAQADGKVLIAGNFKMINGTSRTRIARLNADGLLDSSFDPGTGADKSVKSIGLQTDGKVYIGGQFTMVNGAARIGVARLETDGMLDTSFTPGIDRNSFDSIVNALAVQPDGKVLLGGDFTSVNGMSRNGIARLNTDGSLDTSFNPGSGANSNVYALTLQADGKVLIGGLFNMVNGLRRSAIARLNTDGSVDAGFDAGTIIGGGINSIGLLSDDTVIIAGNFSFVNGSPRGAIALLNPDGSLDTNVDPGTGVGGTIYSLAVQPDDKVILGGQFGTVQTVSRLRIARINADGSLDTTFDPGQGADFAVLAVALRADDTVVIGGDFDEVNNIPRGHVAGLIGGEPHCPGDCDGKDGVTTDEVIMLLNIALGNADASVCPFGVPTDVPVDISLMIQVVNAMSTCGGS